MHANDSRGLPECGDYNDNRSALVVAQYALRGGDSAYGLRILHELYRHIVRCGEQASVDHLLQKIEQELDKHCDVCLISALRTPEYAALMDLPIDWESEKVLANNTLCRRGTVVIDGYRRSVVAAHAKQPGMVSACHLTQTLITALKPGVVIMTGMCGGLPGQARLGDVIIAGSSWDWGSGKWTSGQRFASAADHKEASHELVVCAKAIEPQALDISKELVHLPSPGRVPHLIEGPMLSGSSVVADEALHSTFTAQHRKAAAVDMECYGFYYAATYAPDPKPRFVCIKAVSDLSGAAKADDYQEYCSALSAHVTLRSLERYYREVA